MEIVDELLDAHCVGGHLLPGEEHPAEVGVGGGVHIGGEGGQRGGGYRVEAVFREIAVLLGVKFRQTLLGLGRGARAGIYRRTRGRRGHVGGGRCAAGISPRAAASGGEQKGPCQCKRQIPVCFHVRASIPNQITARAV